MRINRVTAKQPPTFLALQDEEFGRIVVQADLLMGLSVGRNALKPTALWPVSRKESVVDYLRHILSRSVEDHQTVEVSDVATPVLTEVAR
jgi:hypothetical protein